MLQSTCFLLALASTLSPNDATGSTAAHSRIAPEFSNAVEPMSAADPRSALDPVGPFRTSEDGAAWINKAEARLYRWQRPGSIVRFDVKTDALDAAIAAMERELLKAPDREASQLVVALKHAVIHGVADTGSGTVETEVVIDFSTTNTMAKQCLDKLKQLVTELVRGAFEGLPLRDPTLVARNSSVVGAEIQGDAVAVTLSGKQPGEETTLLIDRRSTLPTLMQMPDARLEYEYEEVAPGHFAPTKLEIQSKKAPTRTAEYTYLHLGNLVFPESIRLSQGSQSSRLSFESVRIETKSR
jgi:hypothetical protein